MSGRWDIAVVGAGPAGSCAALAALAVAPDARVLLLDRADFPRDKPCGDGIAPQVLDVLARLGVADVVDGWAPLHRLDLVHGSRVVRGHLTRPVRVIPRQVFDARLADRATAAGATMLRHRVRSVRRTPTLIEVDGIAAARFVIAADGVHSIARPATVRRPRAIAIRGYAPTSPQRRGSQFIRFGDRRQPAYAWAFDRGDGLSNVGYGELAGSPGLTRDVLLDQLDRLIPGAGVDGRQWRAHHLPLSSWRWGPEQPDGPVLTVGDAAGLVNPLTGEGIYYAVATGALAGRIVGEALTAGAAVDAGRRYRHATRGLLGAHLRHTWLTARLARRPLIVDAGIAAAAGNAAVFDDLVDLGLGDGRVTGRLAVGLGRHLVGRLPRRPGA